MERVAIEMNKYQESLHWIRLQLIGGTEDWFKKKNECLDTLQELIDKFAEQEELHFDEKGNYVTENELLKLRIKRYEKALDIACNVLDEGYGNKDAEYEYYTSLCDKKDIPKHMSSKQWKEWLLEDE